MAQLSHLYMTPGKNIALTIETLVGKVISMLFNMMSRFVIFFFSSSKHLLISWMHHHLQWFGSPRKENLTLFPLSLLLFAMKWWDQVPWSWFFECWVLSQLFSLSSLTFIKRLFSSSSLSAIRVVSSVYLRFDIFPQQSWFQLGLHPAWHFAWCILHIS